MEIDNNMPSPTPVNRPDQQDPTELTTKSLLREIGNLKELIFSRLDGYDKAIVLLQQTANRSPTIGEVVSQINEKFNSVQTQFLERDTRVSETSASSKGAVDAALTAAKELNAQQSASITEKIDKSEVSFSNQIKTLDDKIDALTIRTTGSESKGQGGSEIWSRITIIGFAVLAVLFVLFKGGV